MAVAARMVIAVATKVEILTVVGRAVIVVIGVAAAKVQIITVVAPLVVVIMKQSKQAGHTLIHPFFS